MYHGIAFLYKVHVTVASSCGNGLESDPPGRCCVGGLRIARAHLDQGRLLDGPQLLPLLSPHIIAPDELTEIPPIGPLGGGEFPQHVEGIEIELQRDHLAFALVGFAIVIAQKWSLSNLRDTGWTPCPCLPSPLTT